MHVLPSNKTGKDLNELGSRSAKTYKKWAAEDDSILRERYPLEGASLALAASLGCTPKAITHRASALGISYASKWSNEDDEKLRTNFSKCSKEELLLLWDNKKPWTAILGRARKLELIECTPWTTEEDQVLYDWYPDGRWRTIHERLPRRNKNAILNRIAYLGIKMKPEAKARNLKNGIKSVRRFRCYEGYGKVIGSVIAHAQAQAELRKIECPLLDGSLENTMYLDSIAFDTCALSGRPITYKTKARERGPTASLDRIDSSKGYVKGNVQWIHKDINRMKLNMCEETFVEWCCDICGFQRAKFQSNNAA